MSPCLWFNLFPFSIHQYSLAFFGPLVFLFCLLPSLSFLLFIYEIPLSLIMPFPCVVSLYPSICVCCFHYSSCLYFSVYILSLCMPLTLFPFHYFVAIIFIQQLVPLHIPCHPFYSPFLAMIVVSIFPLISTPFFLSHLVFLLYFVFIVIPFIPFMPFCSIFLFGITCTTFLPFLSFIFIIPLTNAASPRTKLH